MREIVCPCGGVHRYDHKKREWYHDRQRIPVNVFRRREMGGRELQWVGDRDCTYTVIYVLCMVHGAFTTDLCKHLFPPMGPYMGFATGSA